MITRKHGSVNRTIAIAILGTLAALPGTARAQACANPPQVVSQNRELFWTLIQDNDFRIARMVVIHSLNEVYFLGQRRERREGAPTSNDQPYILVCNRIVGMLVLRERGFVSAPNSTGATTQVGAGGAQFSSTLPQQGSSFAGVTAVGYIDNGHFTPFHAFRWTESGGLVDLGTLTPASNATLSSRATGVSRDGSVVVGYSDVNNGFVQHAFRWTASTGMVDLGVPAGASRSARAYDVSRDGAVIVGEAEFQDAASFTGIRNSAFRWTAGGGMQSLGALQAGYFTKALDVTPDGSTVVGEGGVEVVVGTSSTNGSRPFRWTMSSGIQNLGVLAGHRFAVANAVSDDGNVVVGTSTPETGSTVAFRWTQATGPQSLRQALITAGLNLTGVELLTAQTISGDGQLIAGEARTPTTPTGETVGYLVQFCDDATSVPCVLISFEPTGNPDFALAAGAAALNVVAGNTVNTALTVSPAGGFNRQVGFSCSGLPSGATCAFSPATVTTGSAVSTTLTITTTGPTTTGFGGALIVVMLVGSTLLLSHRPLPGSRLLRLALPVALAFITSCGGGDDSGTNPPPPPSGGTPPGSYAVSVTATTTTGVPVVTKTVALTLNVTR